jgi:D-3-phosphoglycerate dehydrogenase / 2-oxoglutarate reductase
MQVLITDYQWPSLDIEREMFANAGVGMILAERGDEDKLVRLAPDADAIMACWQRVTPKVLDAAERCRIVARYGIGLDNIAVDHATDLGIVVTNVPDFCLDEVSDHAMALLLACARQIVPFVQHTRDREWNPKLAQRLTRLRGQRLGIVGYGATARALIPKARGFGLEISVYTPRIRPGTIEPGVEATNDLPRMLGASDYVSIHAPWTPETEQMIGAAAFAAMKPAAWLINTSRGALVDEEALIAALEAGQIAGAALDVLAQEPAAPDNPLLDMPNVLVTPHVAFSSEQAVQELQRKAVTCVTEALAGRIPPYVVNPPVLESARLRMRRP